MRREVQKDRSSGPGGWRGEGGRRKDGREGWNSVELELACATGIIVMLCTWGHLVSRVVVGEGVLGEE